MKQVSRFGLGAALMVAFVGLQGCNKDADVAVDASAGPVAEKEVQVVAQEVTEPATIEQINAAEAPSAGAENIEAQIKKTLMTNLPNLPVVGMSESRAKGIYQVELGSGEVIHVTADGKYILNGDLLAVNPGGVDNITEAWRSKKRIAALDSLKDGDLVVFQATGEEKGEVIAFTDTSCGYCQKLHMEVPALNAMGITVKYAAWPRYGVQSPAGQTMKDIWCASDRENAMTLAKTRKPVPKTEGDCDISAMHAQIDLGRQLGVRGTPALFLSDGRKVGGYRKASDLAAEFGLKAN